MNRFVERRQMALDTSQNTLADAQQQGWRFSIKTFRRKSLAVTYANEKGDFREVKAEYDKNICFTFYVSPADGVILAFHSSRDNENISRIGQRLSLQPIKN